MTTLSKVVLSTWLGLASLASSRMALGLEPPEPIAAPGATNDQEADVKAIAELNQNFVKAFNAGDASALVALMTEDAEVIDLDGTKTEGRDAITEKFQELFKSNKGVQIALHSPVLKFLGPDVAKEEGKSIVTSKVGASDVEDATRYSVLFTKRQGQWLQSSVRDEEDPDLSPHDHLKSLAWMVGDWVSENSDSVVHTHCDWVDDQCFLLRTFTVQIAGEPALKGSQRIGWDPVAKQIKSWVFDSVGGHGEGIWTHVDDQWLIKANGVLPEGKVATATQIITCISKDMMTWQSTNRTVGGNELSEPIEFTMVRKPPEPK